MNRAQRLTIAIVSCIAAAVLFLFFGLDMFTGGAVSGDSSVDGYHVFLGLVTPVALVGLAFFVNAGGKAESK